MAASYDRRNRRKSAVVFGVIGSAVLSLTFVGCEGRKVAPGSTSVESERERVLRDLGAKQEAAFRAMSSAEHLATAKKLLVATLADGRINEAKKHLAAIDASAPEHGEAVRAGALADRLKQEGDFVSAAGVYLMAQNDHGMSVARAMAGLNTGQTSMEEVRNAIAKAQAATNGAWNREYLRFGRLLVPRSFASIDTKIRRSHDMRDAAYRKWLSYWRTGSLAAITDGQATFKRSEVLAQEATAALTAALRARH